ncbi:MAG: tyrosine-type recombinase/integrase [Nanobdellota archaeon]
MGFERAFNKFRLYISNRRDALIVEILFETGCNLSELLELKTSDLDFMSRTLKVGGRIVKISHCLAEKIKSRPFGFLFEQNGKIISKRRVEQIFFSYSLKSGVKITPRLIRKNFLNNLLKSKPYDIAVSEIKLKSLKNPCYDFSKIRFPKNKRDLIILAFFYETGCKTNDLINLRVKNISNKGATLNGRRFLLSKELLSNINEIKKNKRKEDFLFLNKAKSKFTHRRIQQIIRGCSVDNSLTPSKLRKHFIFRQIKRGESVNKIKYMLGVKRIDAFTHGFSEVNYEVA